jgi:hypothetical protein
MLQALKLDKVLQFAKDLSLLFYLFRSENKNNRSVKKLLFLNRPVIVY